MYQNIIKAYRVIRREVMRKFIIKKSGNVFNIYIIYTKNPFYYCKWVWQQSKNQYEKKKKPKPKLFIVILLVLTH